MSGYSPNMSAREGISLSYYFATLRPDRLKILALSFAVGAATLAGSFLFPNMFQSTAVVSPASEDPRPIPALGALASLGLSVGSPSKVEDIDALLKSNDLTARVFSKYNLWPIVLPGRFDESTGKIRVGWAERLTGERAGEKIPGDWDAIRASRQSMTVSINRKANMISVSFESSSPEGSAKIVRYYLDEAKSRLQEEAIERAARNKKFIEEQIGRTVDPLTRDRLYSLYGQEVEREMLARNREQFGFRVIDAPRVPDRKSRPQRLAISLVAMLLSMPVWCGFFIHRRRTVP